MYRQTYPSLNLSIEEGTSKVPADGRFYVIERDGIVQGFATLKQGLRRYEQLKARGLAVDVPAGDSQ